MKELIRILKETNNQPAIVSLIKAKIGELNEIVTALEGPAVMVTPQETQPIQVDTTKKEPKKSTEKKVNEKRLVSDEARKKLSEAMKRKAAERKALQGGQEHKVDIGNGKNKPAVEPKVDTGKTKKADKADKKGTEKK